MIKTIYYILLFYFLLGGIGYYVINRKKEKQVARESFIKFAAYLVIINVLFFSIVIEPFVFRILSALIIFTGIIEMLILAFRRPEIKKFAYLSLFIFIILSSGFFLYSGLPKGIVLFTLIVLSVFDSFSQIAGQLFGLRKILPRISPNKTLEGAIGGFSCALVSVLWLYKLFTTSLIDAIIMATGVVIFAFVGDMLASLYKRKFGVKDFSKIIPGNGGFLDRFDSLIAGGAWVTLYIHITTFNY